MKLTPNPFGFISQNYKIMEENKNTRGGKREGAGRKKTTEKRIMFGASSDVLEILEKIEGNKSDFINKAILEYAKKH